MKVHFRLMLAATLAGCAGIDANAESDQCAKATTQLDLNQCSAASMRAADAELMKFTSTYKKRLSPTQVQLFEKAHSAWEHFRRDACGFESSGVEGGSAYPMVYGQCMTEKAQTRLKELQQLGRCEEGDLACPVHN